MQSLPFGSKILGLSSYEKSVAVSTESDGVFVVYVPSAQVKLQFPLPARFLPSGAPVWSCDGDFIWVAAGKTLQYVSPKPSATFNEISLDSEIAAIYPHFDGISVVAALADNRLVLVRPKKEERTVSRKFEASERIVSVVFHQKKMYAAIDGEAPYIEVMDPSKFGKVSTIQLQKRTASLLTLLSSDYGVVAVWSDGYWQRYTSTSNGEAVAFGNVPASPKLFLIGSHVACATPESVRIFDLKFDAELQSFDVVADHILLMQEKCVCGVDACLQIRDWKGATKTTTAALIGSAKAQKQDKRKEISLGISYEEELKTARTCDVVQKDATFKVKSLKHAVESVMEDRFVSQKAKDIALELAEKEPEKDQRNLAMFQLLPEIPYETVKAAIEEENFTTATMMLKKVAILTAEQVTELIRILLPMLDRNEIVLAHIITQPTSDSVLNDAIKSLSAVEANQILRFLAKLIRSRRFWKDYEASLSAFDAAMNWASAIIAAHSAGLTLENQTDGLNEIREELNNEKERIAKAGDCWAILHNVVGTKKSDAPPSFMYLVEKLNIPDAPLKKEEEPAEEKKEEVEKVVVKEEVVEPAVEEKVEEKTPEKKHRRRKSSSK